MGNKLVGRRRQVVDEKYTRPQGLYQHKDVDYKKLRKLILESELAPCYPGHEENEFDLEECPICFLYYPSLNRSRCCMKGICTECFLQMKAPNATRPTQCPFCKTSNYAVEYRGVKTKEEKGLEQIEEQRVIEAKIRIRQQELQDEEERMTRRTEVNSASSATRPTESEYCLTAAPSLASVMEGERLVTDQESQAAAAIKQPPCPRQNRDDEFDLDLEDIMVMEAIWLSIQENRRHRNPAYGDSAPSEHYVAEDCCSSAAIAPVAGTSSPSGGLACAIAALAERQQIGGESSSNYNENMSTYNTLPVYGGFTNGGQETKNYLPAGSSNEISPDSQLMMNRNQGEWVDRRLEVAEVGTSYAGSEEVENSVRPVAEALQDDVGGSFQSTTAPITPESFEEQMMLAMAVSLAEARARTSTPGVAWH